LFSCSSPNFYQWGFYDNHITSLALILFTKFLYSCEHLKKPTMAKLTTIALVALILISTLVLTNCKHELPISCDGSSFQVTLTKTDALLNASNGTITATSSGGSGVKYSLNGGAFQDTGYFSGLAPFSTYRVVGKTAQGCTDTAEIAIGSTDPCSGVTISVTTTKVDASPNQSNGSITATATGGSGFTYSINGGAFQSSGSFNNLAAGNYTVAAKSSAGCLGAATVTIGTNDPCAGITVAVTTTQVNPTTGQSNGSITATATGGSGFTYSLNSGAYQATGTFSGLAAGNYTVAAKNSNGCTGTTTVALGANNPCAGVTITVTTTQVNPTTGQSNGSITASATGGTGFTYSLNNGTFQASGTFANLAAGTYTVTAKNSNGCLGSTQVTLTATSPCTNINIIITTTIVNTTPCVTPANNGSITVTATGSTGFTYNIGGGAYQASNIFANLNAGNYLIGVKDVNGCTKTQTVTVGVIAPGVLFAPVRALISAKCGGSGCHLNGSSAAGHNFDADCSIVTKWSQINGSCVTYTLKRMPINAQGTHLPLTTAEKAAITNWVNAGHRYTD
jgi:SprB repeat